VQVVTESETASVVEPIPAKPSGRQYYVWQFAMWVTIIHTGVVGMTLGFVAVMSNALHIHTLDYVVLVGALLSPAAVIACSRLSMNRGGMGWLAGYWLTIGIILSAPLAHTVYLTVKDAPLNYLFHYAVYDLPVHLLRGAVLFLPIPVTLLAWLLTIGTRRRPEGRAAAA
jgi:hypothetical protein